MDHFIDQIEIRNFKSIRELKAGGFKRINLFIGRPNVGKSNLLEALSLFSLPYLWNNRRSKLSDLVRLETPRQLFYEGNFEEECLINIKPGNEEDLKEHCQVIFDKENNELHFDTFIARPDNPLYGAVDALARDGYYPSLQYRVKFTFDGNLKGGRTYFATPSRDFISYIKYYIFKANAAYKSIATPFLNPPFGENLLYILELMPELRKLYSQWFRQYGLRLVLDTASQSLKVQKEKSEDEVFQLPYSSMADTLQRIIFYKTAVASNQNSVLLFEEPEAHAYPPYIAEFTQEVIKSETNQFFITTHSPLIVEEFLTDAIDDLGIFLVDFKDEQTVLKRLTNDEIREVRRYGVDLFFNNEAYLS